MSSGSLSSNGESSRRPGTTDPSKSKSAGIIKALKHKYPSREKLATHLETLSPEVLQKILITAIHPSNPVLHCVYCHSPFTAAENTGCKIEHFGRVHLVDPPTFKEFSCCGTQHRYNWDDYDPRYIGDKYCYEGKHFPRPIPIDAKVKYNGFPGTEPLEKWWVQIVKQGKMRGCKALRCEEKGLGSAPEPEPVVFQPEEQSGPYIPIVERMMQRNMEEWGKRQQQAKRKEVIEID